MHKCCVVKYMRSHWIGRSQPILLCVTVNQARRRLQESSSKVRLDGQIEFSGTLDAGTDTVTQLSTAGCNVDQLCERIANVSTQVGLVAAAAPSGNVTLTEIPLASDTDPLQFQATYVLADQPASTEMMLIPDPADAMSCTRSIGATSTLFTCYPLRALPAVVVTVNALNPKNVKAPVTASLTVYNTSKSLRCWLSFMPRSRGDFCPGEKLVTARQHINHNTG